MMTAGIVERQAGPFGDFFRVRLAAQFLNEGGGDGADAAHRVDHVDRQANRAALVGDGPGDGLANPPRGVRGELVATLVLELVDRPHQAGVAFLDQVQEAQAAIAVTLGDRDDEPQVGGRENAFGLVVFVAFFERASSEVGQRCRRLERDPHQVAEFLHQLGVELVAGEPLWFGQLLFDRAHALADFVQLLHHRHELAKPKVELFDEPHDLAAAGDEATPGRVLFARRAAAIDRDAVIGLVEPHQVLDRGQVWGEAFESALLSPAVLVTEISIVRSSRSSPARTFSSSSMAPCRTKSLLKQELAELEASLLDPAGRRDFVGTREHRDLAHLHEVHADGVVDVRFGAAFFGQMF